VAVVQLTPTNQSTPYGSNFTLSSDNLATVTLDGTASTTSSAANALTYLWSWSANVSSTPNPPNHEFFTSTTAAVTTFQATRPGYYYVTLTVNDGCSSNSFNFSVLVNPGCTQIINDTASTVFTSFDYVHSGVSQAFCLVAPVTIPTPAGPRLLASTAVVESTFVDFVNRTVINLLPTNNPMNTDPEINSFTYAANDLPQLQCDDRYEWSLVDYSPIAQNAADPCVGLSLDQCTSTGTSAASSTDDNSDPLRKRPWFIGMIVAIVVGVVAVAAVAAFVIKKRAGGGGSSVSTPSAVDISSSQSNQVYI